jgi:hypothetical protein
MKTQEEPGLWTLVRHVNIMPEKLGKNLWIVHVGRSTAWRSGDVCTCVETGGVFTVAIAGIGGPPSGNLPLGFTSVEGDETLEAGFHIKLGR